MGGPVARARPRAATAPVSERDERVWDGEDNKGKAGVDSLFPASTGNKRVIVMAAFFFSIALLFIVSLPSNGGSKDTYNRREKMQDEAALARDTLAGHYKSTDEFHRVGLDSQEKARRQATIMQATHNPHGANTNTHGSVHTHNIPSGSVLHQQTHNTHTGSAPVYPISTAGVAHNQQASQKPHLGSGVGHAPPPSFLTMAAGHPSMVHNPATHSHYPSSMHHPTSTHGQVVYPPSSSSLHPKDTHGFGDQDSQELERERERDFDEYNEARGSFEDFDTKHRQQKLRTSLPHLSREDADNEFDDADEVDGDERGHEDEGPRNEKESLATRITHEIKRDWNDLWAAITGVHEDDDDQGASWRNGDEEQEDEAGDDDEDDEDDEDDDDDDIVEHIDDDEDRRSPQELMKLADATFFEMDKNKDGRVTFKEYFHVTSRDAEPDEEVDEKEEKEDFNEIDANHDHYISRGEMRNDWLEMDFVDDDDDDLDNDEDGEDDDEDLEGDDDLEDEDGYGRRGPVAHKTSQRSKPLSLHAATSHQQYASPYTKKAVPYASATHAASLETAGGHEADGEEQPSFSQKVKNLASKLFKSRAPKPHKINVKLFQAPKVAWSQADMHCKNIKMRLCPMRAITQLKLCKDTDPHHRGRHTPVGDGINTWIDLDTCKHTQLPTDLQKKGLIACC